MKKLTRRVVRRCLLGGADLPAHVWLVRGHWCPPLKEIYYARFEVTHDGVVDTVIFGSEVHRKYRGKVLHREAVK